MIIRLVTFDRLGTQSSTNQRAGQIVNKSQRKMHFTL
jgi:hypothetical protein